MKIREIFAEMTIKLNWAKQSNKTPAKYRVKSQN